MNLQWLVGSWPHKNENKMDVPADTQHRECLMGPGFIELGQQPLRFLLQQSPSNDLLRHLPLAIKVVLMWGWSLAPMDKSLPGSNKSLAAPYWSEAMLPLRTCLGGP